jgi:hypothetical protein
LNVSTDDDDPYANAPTPPIRKRTARYAMALDERDGADRRRAEAQAYALSAVVEQDDEPDTGPIATLESVELDADDFQLANRLRRETPDPYALFLKALKLIRRQRHDIKSLESKERSNNTERANQILELLNRPPHEDVLALQQQVADLKRFTDSQRKVLGWIGGGLISAVIAVGVFLYSRGVSEGGAAVRMQQLERTVEQLQHRLYPDLKGP